MKIKQEMKNLYKNLTLYKDNARKIVKDGEFINKSLYSVFKILIILIWRDSTIEKYIDQCRICFTIIQE